MENIRNIIIAFVAAAIFIAGGFFFFNKSNPVSDEKASEFVAADTAIQNSKSHRLHINTPKLSGSINLEGLFFDDLVLNDYKEENKPASKSVKLLNPKESDVSYFANFGWLSGSDNIKMPDSQSIWRADENVLSPNKNVNLSWNNGSGLTFMIRLEIDDDYMISMTHYIKNDSAHDVTIMPYGLVSRILKDKLENNSILHEGPVGVFDGILTEQTFDKLKDERKTDIRSNKKGWLGISDKYWLAAMVPDARYGFDASYNYKIVNGLDRFQVDYLGQKLILPKDASVTYITHLFAGAKSIALLDEYEKTFNIDKLDHAIDFGWLYFLTKPFFLSLQFINQYTNNFGIAILVFTVLVKLIMLPLANKSYASMTKMKELNPVIARLRDKFKDDKMRFNYEVMQLYKREKVNPLSGCMPILIQIPVFFALYKVLYITIEMRHAPFFGWITDLSAPDPTSFLNLFGFAPWDAPNFLRIGVLPLIMGVTMYMQQRLNPEPADPVQAQVSKFMPVIFTFMFYNFPSGLVIYWAWNNILSILQQLYVQKKVVKQLRRF